MQCANCGRQNQPTTRFCAECGDVLRSDSPRAGRSRSTKRHRKLRSRIHWVRVPPAPKPSIITAGFLHPASAIAAQQTSERMMRRVDLVFAALVGIAGLAAYVAYPYLKGAAPAETIATVAAPASSPQPFVGPPVPLADAPTQPAPIDAQAAQAAVAPAPVAMSSKLDVVPPRAAAPRPKAGADPSNVPARAAPAAARPPYALSTAFGGDVFTTTPSAPARVATAAPKAPARKDRLQQMNEAISGCAGEGFFGRVACEQRALLDYCDGQWGQNERCPSGRRTDYGN